MHNDLVQTNRILFFSPKIANSSGGRKRKMQIDKKSWEFTQDSFTANNYFPFLARIPQGYSTEKGIKLSWQNEAISRIVSALNLMSLALPSYGPKRSLDDLQTIRAHFLACPTIKHRYDHLS